MSHRLATPSDYITHRTIHGTAVEDKTGKGMAFRAVKQCKLMMVMNLRVEYLLCKKSGERLFHWSCLNGWMACFSINVNHVIPSPVISKPSNPSMK